MAQPSDLELRAQAAFPGELAPAVRACLRAVQSKRHSPSLDDLEPVHVAGETLRIPYRIYPQALLSDVVRSLDQTQRLVLACLLTRHHDGYERQRQLEQLLAAAEDWVPPYVLQLTGEYVVEIIAAIADRAGDLVNDRYLRFAAANPRFIAVTKRRVVSYWNEYYRHRFPRFVDYPGFKVLDALQLWDSSDSPRLRAR